jgi:hypothetical protein
LRFKGEINTFFEYDLAQTVHFFSAFQIETLHSDVGGDVQSDVGFVIVDVGNTALYLARDKKTRTR